VTVASRPVDLCDEVRHACAAIAASARWVRIDPSAAIEPGGRAGLDPQLHLLDADPEAVARYVLILDAINFGSGWFAELGTDTDSLTRGLTAHARAAGPWTAAELRGLDAGDVAVLGLDPAHQLTRLYAEGLRQLGGWLGARTALEAVGAGSAAALARSLASMPFYADTGFYKRAQITANDLVLASVASYPDVDRLTAFADNLIPHVLRVDGMLAYAPELAARVDTGEELAAGSPEEVEIRACAVHACELLASRWDVAPRVVDNWLWNRGKDARYRERPAHVTKTVFY
jgi:hypothetical protein